MEPPGLYVHIPFCISKCPYCAFASVTDANRIPPYLDALDREMAMYRDDGWPPFDTLYLGGGTPSALPPPALERILAMVRAHFCLLPDAEITVEVNPGDGDRRLFHRLRQWGVNRLQVGVQSVFDDELRFLGRRHSAREALAAVEEAKAAGYRRIGIDLIYALPGQDDRRWRATLDTALSLDVEHLSCYELTVEKGTPFAAALRRDAWRIPGEDDRWRLLIATAERLSEAGYIHYEVSNFARDEGSLSRHNGKYWRHVPYLGIGASAHSFDGKRRWWNDDALDVYLARTAQGAPPRRGAETLSENQRKLETLFLGLRTRRGIDLEDYRRRFGRDLLREKGVTIEGLLAGGFLELRPPFLRPTLRGMAVADRLALI